ncbi:hypothetical protein NXS98_05855 [Fontisphaera persica]|uniref:hypothetical protein n=1 Tax=Fontisphaera persica TaxID=2974023 RepID=UPI0024BFE7D5|nr:hypothetical protein [Fontisphaera persica]WCJ60651.1 hypothetical protein NXS98_05855 [Fontisphaera persica]
MRSFCKRLLMAAVACVVAVSLLAANSSSAPSSAEKPAAREKSGDKTKLPPGYEAAETLSLITGVAISPLLGVGAVGCYQWMKNASKPENERRPLHWYAQPWFWIPALIIVALVFLKDTLGTAAPTVLKKPMDVAEAIENKVSGLIAAGAFVPLVTQVFPEAMGESASWSALGFAALDLNGLLNALMVPVAMAVFFIVWLASHAINMLILISPFNTVDMALKSFRMFLLSLVATTHWINPYLGALFAIVLIVICYFIAGWSFRLLVMGSNFVWDYLTFRRLRFLPRSNANWMFTATKWGGMPVRTCGRLCRTESGALQFEYRPWLFLPKKTVPLPSGALWVGRGLFYPEVLVEAEGHRAGGGVFRPLFYPEVLVEAEGSEAQSLFILPPRYSTHEEDLCRVYQMKGVRDIGLLRGFKLLWAWLKGLVGGKPRPAPAMPPQVA